MAVSSSHADSGRLGVRVVAILHVAVDDESSTNRHAPRFTGLRAPAVLTKTASDTIHVNLDRIRVKSVRVETRFTNRSDVVGEAGLEPAISCSQSTCVTRLRYSPPIHAQETHMLRERRPKE